MEPLGAGDPRQIGAYRLLGRLGAGGMGRVYLGRTEGGRTVAVKLVRSELADDQDFRARFRQEVAAARRVGGRWTAAVLDADTESEQPWVATGYVPGPGLDAAVREFGVLSEQSVRALGVGLADALAAVHATGLVHRDVKPSNVLITLDGPRLIDFGIARALDAATALTRSGYVVGSPGYMSPEQGAGEQAGAPSDVFSLGGVLAFAATASGPFGDSTSAPVLLYRVMHEPPRLDAMAPGELRDIVGHCLAKAPEDRPTPGELRHALGGVGPSDGWLPPMLVASVGRRTAELLDLDTAGASWRAGGTGSGVGSGVGFGPAPVMDAVPAVTDVVPGVVPGVEGDAATLESPGGRRTRRAPLVIGGALLVVFAAVLLPLALNQHGRTPGGAPSTYVGTPTLAPTGGAVALTPPAAPSPGPSSPNAVPAAFLGTWSGTMTTSDGLLTEPFAISIRPGPAGAENSTAITTVNGVAGVSCLGGEKLVSATATTITFQDRLLPGSSPLACSSASEAQVFTLNPDGTLHHQDNGAGSGTPSGDLRRTG